MRNQNKMRKCKDTRLLTSEQDFNLKSSFIQQKAGILTSLRSFRLPIRRVTNSGILKERS
jgi:hypothetical protein